MTDTKRRTKARARVRVDGPVSENYKTLFQETAAAAKYRSVLLTLLSLFSFGIDGIYIKSLKISDNLIMYEEIKDCHFTR